MMPRHFQVTGKLWMLRCGSPFPDELEIIYDKERHGTIRPSSGHKLKEKQLKEVGAVRN